MQRGLTAAVTLYTQKSLISYEILKSSGYNFWIKGIIQEQAGDSYRENDHVLHSYRSHKKWENNDGLTSVTGQKDEVHQKVPPDTPKSYSNTQQEDSTSTRSCDENGNHTCPITFDVATGWVWWRSWLSHCDTSRKVAGLIRGGSLRFFINLILPATLWSWDRLSL